MGQEYELVRQNLWAALEAEIHPSDCEIYSFLGDSQDDPFSEPGTLWSFVYLFYNKKLKRVLFFTCQGLRWGGCAWIGRAWGMLTRRRMLQPDG